MIALLDADIMCYRVGFATENETESAAISTMAVFLEELVMFDLTDVESYELFLTGKTNFRNSIAVTAPYKGNRKDVPKPKHLKLLREYLQKGWEATVSEGQEADDSISIRATEIGADDAIIVSIDKDFLQVNSWHYNFLKKVKQFVKEEEGLRFFYQQILMGDAADNIKGAGGLGPVKSQKILKEAMTPYQLYQCCVEVMGKERVLENGQLLWLRRFNNQLWTPPNEEKV
tara:strand:+ start:2210 stop:2899 length:690 start_codon:yes stop_codon:yes gene_type:complete